MSKKIYKEREEWVKDNLELIVLTNQTIRDGGWKGVSKMTWEARQPEVDGLGDKLDRAVSLLCRYYTDVKEMTPELRKALFAISDLGQIERDTLGILKEINDEQG